MPTFAPLYVEVTRFLMERRDRVALQVLQELANCANEIGVCFPGVRYLARITGYAEKTCLDALARLECLDLIHTWTHYDPETRRELPRYQLSPLHTLYIREELLGEAMAIWTRPFVSYVRHDFRNDHDPESDPESQPESRTNASNQYHNQNNTTTTNHTFPEGEVTGVYDDETQPDFDTTDIHYPYPPAAQRSNAGTAQSANSASRTGANAPNPSPVPPPPSPTGGAAPKKIVDLSRFTDPFDDPKFESAAQSFHQVTGNTTMQWARYYVALYNPERVIAALMLLQNQPNWTETIENPTGYIVSHLRKNAVGGRDRERHYAELGF